MWPHSFTFSLPWRNCGSEVVIHELLKAAAADGHDVTLWCTNRDAQRNWNGTEPETILDGIKIRRVRNVIVGGRQVQTWKPHVIVSHHQHVMHAIRVARQVKARSVFLTHNDYDLNRRPLRMRPDLVIHNSTHVHDTLTEKFGPDRASFVFHPPLTRDRHTVSTTGDGLTLINLNADKGAHLFYKLAEVMLDRQFVGVIGGHGIQVIRRNLPNVTILDHGPDMKRVWSRTRVLLMPSEFESYGLTAVEAGINGIPTIAHPTRGLVENLGPGGLFADRDDPAAWVRQIESLDDWGTYTNASSYAHVLSEQAQAATRRTLSQWQHWLQGV